MGRGVGGGDPSRGLLLRAVLRDRLLEQSLLVGPGAPAAVDDELDSVARGVVCGALQRVEEIGIEVGYTRNALVEDRRAVGDGAVGLAERTALGEPAVPARRTGFLTEGGTEVMANDGLGSDGRRRQGVRQHPDESRDDRSDHGNQAGGADPATPTPINRCRCWFAVDHAAIQGSGVLPVRMRFSICRRYAAALASVHARTGRRGRTPDGGGNPRWAPSGS